MKSLKQWIYFLIRVLSEQWLCRSELLGETKDPLCPKGNQHGLIREADEWVRFRLNLDTRRLQVYKPS